MCNEIYDPTKCEVSVFKLILNAAKVHSIVINSRKTDIYCECMMNAKMAQFGLMTNIHDENSKGRLQF